MGYKSHNAAVKAVLHGAAKHASFAGAAILAEAIAEKHERGFTSGDFVTGNAARHVVAVPDESSAEPTARVVSTLGEDGFDYDAAWSLGHFNVFLRKFVRVDHWTPTALEERDRIAAAMTAIYKAEISGLRLRTSGGQFASTGPVAFAVNGAPGTASTAASGDNIGGDE